MGGHRKHVLPGNEENAGVTKGGEDVMKKEERGATSPKGGGREKTGTGTVRGAGGPCRNRNKGSAGKKTGEQEA